VFICSIFSFNEYIYNAGREKIPLTSKHKLIKKNCYLKKPEIAPGNKKCGFESEQRVCPSGDLLRFESDRVIERYKVKVNDMAFKINELIYYCLIFASTQSRLYVCVQLMSMNEQSYLNSITCFQYFFLAINELN
jgi:hypothetical protein